MSDDTFKAILIGVAIVGMVAIVAITAEVMQQHPAIPWFVFGLLAAIVIEGIGYLVYRVVHYFRESSIKNRSH